MPTLFQAPETKVTPPKHGKHTTHGGHKAHLNPLASFVANPHGLRFETQTEEETVILFLRQHFIVNISWIAMAIVLFFMPTVAFPFVLRFFPFPVSLPPAYYVVGTIFWYVATSGFVLANFIHWFFNIYIITNKRVVDIDFRNLLFKEFSEADLNKIQDLTYTSGGIMATLFDYGTVYVQTAGELPNIEFELVPHPEKIVQTIRSLAGKMRAHPL